MEPKLSTADAARLLGLRQLRVRELARRLLGHKRSRGRRYAFDFRDLVVLRAAARLLERRVPATRVARALAALGDRLPGDQPLSGVRLYAEGARVAVREGGRSWDPETGQILLDFAGAPGDAPGDTADGRVIEGRLAPTAPRPATGETHAEFDRALELEEVDPRAACDAYQRTLELDPDFVDAYINLGRLAHEAGCPLEAIQLYQEALDRRPGDPVIHFNLALAVEDCSGPERAVPHYERALALDPAFADAHFNLAGIFERLERPQEALRHYRSYRRLTQRKG